MFLFMKKCENVTLIWEMSIFRRDGVRTGFQESTQELLSGEKVLNLD